MTPGRRVRGIAAVLATLAAATLATTAQNDAHAANERSGWSGAGASKPTTTVLHMQVSGCDRCSVQLQQAIHGRDTVWRSTSKRIGDDHVVTFRVHSHRTVGMSFVLRAPWAKNLDCVPTITTRYAGHQVDSLVTRSEARHADRAAGCWAGTRLNRVDLGFHVSRIAAEAGDGSPTQAPLVYATHSMSSWKPFRRYLRGSHRQPGGVLLHPAEDDRRPLPDPRLCRV